MNRLPDPTARLLFAFALAVAASSCSSEPTYWAGGDVAPFDANPDGADPDGADVSLDAPDQDADDLDDAEDALDADSDGGGGDVDTRDAGDGMDVADADAPPTPRCGDGVLDDGEICDDGNAFENDACTNSCLPARCGDGLLQRGNGETCDDGNDVSGDGCHMCLREATGGPGVFALVGHDFSLTTDPAPVEFIANVLARAASADGRVVVADFIALSDVHAWSGHARTWAALEPVMDDREIDVERVPVDDPHALFEVLPRVDALLLPVPDADEERPRMGALGALWARALRGFIDRGGVVVSMDAAPTYGQQFTRATGLLDPSFATELLSESRTLNVETDHDLAPSVATYTAPYDTAFFEFEFSDSPGTPIVQWGASDNHVISVFESTCGDGVVDDGEGCDDGNRIPDDGCNERCQASECGDGIVDDGEACDDGNRFDGDTCRADCSAAARCGDGVVQALLGEGCDDGAGNDDALPDGCRTDCSLSRCGDGVVDMDEACDDGNDVNDDGCSNVCRTPGCPDGVVADGEACDDGNTVDDDGCSNACEVGYCGDGLVQRHRGEECDDGGTINADGCDAGCLRESNGGFVVWLGYTYSTPSPGAEQVLANALRLPTWTGTLQVVAFDEEAERELGVHEVEAAVARAMTATGTDYELVRIHHVELLPDALAAADALIVHPNERTTPSAFRDAVREAIEPFVRAGGVAIALGNYSFVTAPWGIEASLVVAERESGASPVPGSPLSVGVPDHALAAVPYAFSPYYPGRVRYGVVDGRDQPVALSRQITCGDGIRQVWAGEACDDGNDDEEDGCLSSCGTTVCGNGEIEAGEACDDGNRFDTDACANNCRATFCGDGRVNNDEECDDGNVVASDGCELDCTRTTNVPDCGSYAGTTTGRVRSGKTETAPNEFDAGCGNSGTVGDVLVWWRAPEAGNYRFDVTSPDDSETTVSLWEPGGACTDPGPLACNADSSGTGARLERTMAEEELIGIVVDAYADPSVFCWFDWCPEGEFVLTVTRL